MSDSPSDLRFDRATYDVPAGATTANVQPCGNCRGPLGLQYWKWQRLVVCQRCLAPINALFGRSQSRAAFARAAVLGAGTAVGCGAAYAVFVAVTNFQIAFVTLGIAFLVAKVIRKASFGLSGRRYQVLAVGLTYIAAVMGYSPGLVRAFAPHVHSVSHAFRVAPMFIRYLLAAPFLEATSAPIGLLIVGLGLFEAWKLTKGLPLHVEGPFRVAQSPASSPALEVPHEAPAP